MSAKSTIASKRAATWSGRMPRIAALRWTFSRPVRSGWKPAPTSSRPGQAPPHPDPAGVGRHDARDELEQGRLARAVRPSRATDSPWPISRSRGASATKSSWRARPWTAQTSDSFSEWVCRSAEVLGGVLHRRWR